MPFYGPSLPLQIIPIVSRSPVTFYGPSIDFTDHSYRLQVTCTFLLTSHSFYISFLSSPGHLYLFTDYPLLLQILSIVSRSSVPFYGQSIVLTDPFYHLQVICAFLRTIHCLYRSFLSFPGHLYLLRTFHCFNRSFLSSPVPFNHCLKRSFLSSSGHLYFFTDHP